MNLSTDIYRRLGVRGILFSGALAVTVVALTMFSAASAGDGERSAVEPLPTLTPEQRAEQFHFGPPWDGKGKGNLGETEIMAFSNYPLLWLGAEIAGYNLQWVSHVQYDAERGLENSRAWDAVTFIYGTCTPVPDAKSCVAPISLDVHPICDIQPEIVANRVKAGTPFVARGGALVQRLTEEHHALVWTGSVVVDLSFAADPELFNSVISELQSLGEAWIIEPGSPLPPPDFSGCPPINFEELRIIPDPVGE